ncbi:MAG: O-antigen ligase family protein, partial [Puniceicoccales bacterium]
TPRDAESSSPGDLQENLPPHPWIRTTGIVLIACYLIAASWLFGGVLLWTRLILFWMAAATLLVAIAPIPNRRDRITAPGATGRALLRLLKFPPFWFGLLLFVYVGLQWANPSWTMTEMGGKWWISNVGLKPTPNWPTSIYASPERGNPESFLIRFGGVWLIICAGWILIRNRRDLMPILIAFAINSFVVAVVALIQKMDQPDKILWLYPWKGVDFSGPFFYRNHGAAFFYLSMAVCFGLALYFQRNRDFRRDKSSPGPVFIIFGLLNTGATLSSGSRAGWIFGSAVLCVYLILAAGLWLRRGQWRGSWVGGVVVASCVMVLVGSVVAAQNTDYLEYHFRRFLRIPNELERSGRTIGNEASFQMLEDVKVFGYGADSYGHAFSLYIDDYPALVRKHRKSGRIRTNWVQAHNDPLQMAVELGIVGASILALSPLFFLLVFLFRFLSFREESILWFVTVLFLFAHSFVDLIFQSTVLLALFAFLLLAVERSLTFQKHHEQLKETS